MRYIAGVIAAALIFAAAYFGYRLIEGEYWPNTYWIPIVIGTFVGRVYAGTKIAVHLEEQRRLQQLQLAQIARARQEEREKLSQKKEEDIVAHKE